MNQFHMQMLQKNNTNPALLILPKDQKQSNNNTKSELFDKVDPLNTDIHLTKVKNTKNGVGCTIVEENRRFKDMVTKKLSEYYEVREVKGVHPRIRVVDITEKLTVEEVDEYCNQRA